jgi:maltooligosyltrehalose trehalohydrolase
MATRRFAIGAEPDRGRGTHFRVWAPAAHTLEVVERAWGDGAPGKRHVLDRGSGGYFSGFVAELDEGDLYSLRIDGGDTLYPDPASRYQPSGPHGPSQIVDPNKYLWGDEGFAGPHERGQVLYELHVGTFTREGTYSAAAEQLAELAALGVTTIELMPLAEFTGEFGWGYDGVDLWAPTRLYGAPDDLRRFIDRAHQLGLSVVLDVVYNHFGPDGCYLKSFSPDYFTKKYENEWGESINFDGDHAGSVREFFIDNARYWISEYHFDGLRLDATQSILDDSPRHVIADITTAVRQAGRTLGKRVYVTAENEPQDARLVLAPEQGGHGCDSLWNDDFHHTARVAATGRREAYYQDYGGKPQELISALRHGYLYQGQHYYWQKKQRGRSALGLGAHQYVSYLQNHDQIANTLAGERLGRLSDPALVRALTTLWLLAPPTPMLFQGQEFGASTPFLYFADHPPELGELVAKGRRDFLSQFPSISDARVSARLAKPAERTTFERCKLDFSEREKHAPLYALHKDLLRLRHEDAVFAAQRADVMHGSVLSEQAFLLRFHSELGDRLIVVNLGHDLALEPAPEPLLAPPPGRPWRHVLGSEDVKYGGSGFTPPYDQGKWKLTARSAHVFVPGDEEHDDARGE